MFLSSSLGLLSASLCLILPHWTSSSLPHWPCSSLGLFVPHLASYCLPYWTSSSLPFLASHSAPFGLCVPPLASVYLICLSLPHWASSSPSLGLLLSASLGLSLKEAKRGLFQPLSERGQGRPLPLTSRHHMTN